MLTVGVDVGLYRCWWTAWAWLANAEGYCVDYGCLDVPQGGEANTLAILNTLRAFRDDTLSYGWKFGEATRSPDLCVVDSGYESDIIYQFVKESGQGRYLACRGLGTTNRRSTRRIPTWSAPKKAKGRMVGHEWVITRQPSAVRLLDFHSDYWKRQVHDGFGAPGGAGGSLHLFHGETRDHREFVRHILAERERFQWEAKTGMVSWWEQVHRENHYFDCTYMSRAAADVRGVRLLKPAVAAKPVEPPPSPRDQDKTQGKGSKWKIGR